MGRSANAQKTDWARVEKLLKKNGIAVGKDPDTISILFAIIERRDMVLLRAMLEVMSEDDLFLLNARNSRGKTLAYLAVEESINMPSEKKFNLKLLKPILEKIPEGARLEYLTMKNGKNGKGKSVLDLAIMVCDLESCIELSKLVPENEASTIINEKIKISLSNKNAVELLGKISGADRVKVLSALDIKGNTLLHNILYRHDPNVGLDMVSAIKEIMKLVSNEAVIEFLMKKNKDGRSVIAESVRLGRVDIMEALFGELAGDVKMKVLDRLYAQEEFVIEAAVNLGRTKVAEYILTKIPKEEVAFFIAKKINGESIVSRIGRKASDEYFTRFLAMIPKRDRLYLVRDRIVDESVRHGTRLMLNLLDDNERDWVFTSEIQSGRSMLDVAILSGDLEKLQSMMNYMSKEAWDKYCASHLSGNGEMHEAIASVFLRGLNSKFYPISRSIFENCPGKLRLNLFCNKNIQGDLSLDCAAKTLRYDRFIDLLRMLPDKSRLVLAREIVNQGNDAEKLREVSSLLSEEDRVRLVIDRDGTGRSIIISAILRGDEKYLQALISLIPEKYHGKLLYDIRHAGEPSLVLAVESSNDSMLKLIYELYPESARREVLSFVGRMGNTLMHEALTRQDVDAAFVLFHLYPDHLKRDVLLEENNFHESVAEVLDCLNQAETFLSSLRKSDRDTIESKLKNKREQNAIKKERLRKLDSIVWDHLGDFMEADSLRACIRKNDVDGVARALDLLPLKDRLDSLRKIYGSFSGIAVNIRMMQEILQKLPEQSRSSFIKEAGALHAVVSRVRQNGFYDFHVNDSNEDDNEYDKWMRKKMIASGREVIKRRVEFVADNHNDVFGVMRLLQFVPEKDRKALLMSRNSDQYTVFELAYGHAHTDIFDKKGNKSGKSVRIKKGMPAGESVLKEFMRLSNAIASIQKYAIWYQSNMKENVLKALRQQIKKSKKLSKDERDVINDAIKAWEVLKPDDLSATLPKIPDVITDDGLRLSRDKMTKMVEIMKALNQLPVDPIGKLDRFAKQFEAALPVLQSKADKMSMRILRSIAHVLASVMTLGLYAGIRAFHSQYVRGSAAFWRSNDEILAEKISEVVPNPKRTSRGGGG